MMVNSKDSTQCIDICGDGKKVNSDQECDDGNTIDGDGCSSECKIEDGWNCSSTSLTTPDTC